MFIFHFIITDSVKWGYIIYQVIRVALALKMGDECRFIVVFIFYGVMTLTKSVVEWATDLADIHGEAEVTVHLVQSLEANAGEMTSVGSFT